MNRRIFVLGLIFFLIVLIFVGLSSLGPNTLSEIKWIYWQHRVDPCLADRITIAIDEIIKHKIYKTISLGVNGKRYSPIDMYVVSCVDPVSYEGKLDNGYADDSLHLSEFVTDEHLILYDETTLFLINLDENFRFVVKPHIYPKHSWLVEKVTCWQHKSFKLLPTLSRAVLFAVVEEKGISKRKYKVFWLVDFDE